MGAERKGINKQPCSDWQLSEYTIEQCVKQRNLYVCMYHPVITSKVS